MKKALSAIGLVVICFLCYFFAALAKGLPQHLSVGICAAIAAGMTLITIIICFLKKAFRSDGDYEEA